MECKPHPNGILLYSGGCPVCRYTAYLLSKVDRDICLIPLRDEDAAPFISDIPEDVRYSHWQYIDSNGVRWCGNKGGPAAMLQRWDLTRWFARALIHLGCSGVLDWLDDFVNRNRPRIRPFVPDVAPIKRYEEV